MTQEPVILEMTIEGDFISSAPEAKPTFSNRLLVWAVAIMGIAVAGTVAVFTLWLLAFLIPFVLLALLCTYVLFRVRLWRGGGGLQTYTFRWPPSC